jgi:ribosomal protein S18 acetylase RimI-like enzyme
LSRVEVRRLQPAEWADYREVRRRALRDAPWAFGSSLAEADRLSEADWRQRLADRAIFVATTGGLSVGLVAGIATEAPNAAELISMWVDPDWRGRGIGDQLVSRVIDWATEHGLQTIQLWVAEGNQEAERLYRRHGFSRTGERQLMPSATNRTEFGMIRQAGPVPG